MTEFKYIVIRKGSFEHPIIFPDKLVHEDVAVAMFRMEQFAAKEDPFEVVVVAAGTVDLDSALEDAYCHKGSETLNLASRGKQDSSLIGGFRYGHGIATEEIKLSSMRFSPTRGLPVYGEPYSG